MLCMWTYKYVICKYANIPYANDLPFHSSNPPFCKEMGGLMARGKTESERSSNRLTRQTDEHKHTGTVPEPCAHPFNPIQRTTRVTQSKTHATIDQCLSRWPQWSVQMDNEPRRHSPAAPATPVASSDDHSTTPITH